MAVALVAVLGGLGAGPVPSAQAGPIVYLDLAAGWTPAAEAYNPLIGFVVVAEVNRLNETLANSQIDIRVRLISNSRIDGYTQQGGVFGDWDRLKEGNNGLTTFRRTGRLQRADLMTLFTYYPQAGASCGFGTPRSFGDTLDAGKVGYSVVNVSAERQCDDLTLAHEIGHNLGGGHNPEAFDQNPAPWKPYAYDHTSGSGQFFTTLAYRNCTPCAHIPYFSNPNVSYNGYPTGTADRNNALVMNEIAPYSAVWGGTTWAASAALDTGSGNSTGEQARAEIFNGQIHLFNRGGNNRLRHLWSTNPGGTNFSGQETVISDLSAGTGIGSAVYANQIHTFYRDATGQLVHYYKGTTGAWIREPHSPPAGIADASQITTLVHNNQLHAFYRTNGGAIGHSWYDPPHNQWFHSSSGGNVATDSRIGASWLGSSQHVFYRKASGAVGHTWYDAAYNAWFDETLPSAATMAAGSGVAAVKSGNEEMKVFYVATDGKVHQTHWNITQWQDTNLNFSAAANSGLAAFVEFGHLSLYFSTSLGGLVHADYHTTDNNWQTQWVDSTFAGNQWVAALPGYFDTRLHVFYSRSGQLRRATNSDS